MLPPPERRGKFLATYLMISLWVKLESTWRLPLSVVSSNLEVIMTLRYVHWKDGLDFLGYLMDYPDYMTQGTSQENFKEHLIDLYRYLSSGELPYVKNVYELVITA